VTLMGHFTLLPSTNSGAIKERQQNSYQQGAADFGSSRKKAETKKRKSPTPPYREKAKGKENKPGVLENPYKPAGARTRARERYQEANLAALEIMDALGSTSKLDHRLWAYYCYHHDRDIILEKAYEYASMQRQGEVRDAIRAFQAWLSRAFWEKEKGKVKSEKGLGKAKAKDEGEGEGRIGGGK